MLAAAPHEAFNPVAVAFIVSAGLAALFASRVLSVLVGLPARAWQQWLRLRSRPATMVVSPVRPDLSAPVARFVDATRSLLDELMHVQVRVVAWSDGARPGLLARWVGYRSDDDYQPTIELFGEIARWLQHGSELERLDGPEVLEVRHACERVRALVLADGELASRVDGIVDTIAELDARLTASDSSPYRDRRPAVRDPGPLRTADDERDQRDERDGRGEASSRARVLATHEEVFRRVAARYADDAHGREDLRQEIRLAVWLALPKHRGDASLGTYVRRIAHYCGARFGRRQFKVERMDEPLALDPDPEEQLDDEQRRAALQEALRALPLVQREAIELLLTGLSYREIADRLGISESNASVRITRARKQLREQLAPIYA